MQFSVSESLMQSTTLESPMQPTSLESTSQSPFHAVMPPEVLERIAFYADPHTLTICVRACRLWFACFLPPLYQNINIYHFDYFSTDLGDGYPRRSDKVIRTADTVGYGGQFIHKYGRFIETVTVGTAYALKYLLQPECVNLQEVTTMSPLVKHYWRVRGMPSDFSKYRVMPKNNAELSTFRNQFGYEGSSWLVTQIWIPLFTQNPGLRRISLNNSPGGDREAAELLKAMGTLAHLEEVYFKFIVDSGILERVLDFCPQVRKITIETFINKYSNPYQAFRSRNNFNEITDEPKTQVRELDLFSKGRIQRSPWIVPVLWRCPLLESLIVPVNEGPVRFPVVARAIVEHCPEIRHLYVRIHEEDNSTETVDALASLLNTGCPRLTSLRLYDAADFFLLEQHFMNRDLRQRLEQFVCTSGSERYAVAGSKLVFGVLSVCPNLRVFEAHRMTLDAMDFLEMDIACFRTLTTLYLRLRYPQPPLLQVEDEDVQATGNEEEEKRQETIEGNEKSKEQVDRLYRLHLQFRILDKLAQFTALKILRLESNPQEDRFQMNARHLEIGEAEKEKDELLQRFVQMRRLEKLKVDGMDYSRKIRRMRC